MSARHTAAKVGNYPDLSQPDIDFELAYCTVGPLGSRKHLSKSVHDDIRVKTRGAQPNLPPKELMIRIGDVIRSPQLPVSREAVKVFKLSFPSVVLPGNLLKTSTIGVLTYISHIHIRNLALDGPGELAESLTEISDWK